MRGVTDSSGTLTGATSYDAFRAVRSHTGSSLSLGYTGQLTDPTTGFLDLRAREMDPTLGRFLSADTVQPNAPGTQGYNLYAYTANNPTTWVDPSGNSVSDTVNGFLYLATACRLDPWCAVPLIDGLRRVASGEWLVQAGGFVESVLAVVACALTSSCLRLSEDIGLIVTTYGGGVDTGGGNRPPSPATCIRDAVNGLAISGVPGAIHACAEAIRTSSTSGSTIYPIQGGSGSVVPQKAYDVYKYIKDHNWTPMPGYAGNSVFLNTLNQLPPAPVGTYHEYDIDPRPAPGGPGRNSERIVVNIKTGEAWYTSNHYGKIPDGNPPFIPMF